ncbi:hypothetical protein ACEWX3_07565 [Mycobacterium sp. G7A2]|uniref:hypothetical protein n=1 Tax=Mycobacterium sp. G7A2 TaxID=3317307 RepID=UPI0035A89A05
MPEDCEHLNRRIHSIGEPDSIGRRTVILACNDCHAEFPVLTTRTDQELAAEQ